MTTGRPIACVLGVVIRDGEILLIRRANAPDRGKWGFPGGKIERGETVLAAAAREVAEETGIATEAVAVLTAVDVFEKDQAGRLQRHFVLIAVRCRWIAGEPIAADDALEAGWWPIDRFAELDLSVDVEAVARGAILAG
ncbi:mutator protein MutT [Rhodoligotrophos appendicifer]|uniref:NUDIX hydrolase n=1 Tax=Rhodoligotrophos appendicifer TaxID=987056 RepID=UPI0011851FF7|nr:NUDIX hydrolase [Rhodoligotrophos appendicifer]